jgi:hypothetical protein
VVLQILFLCNEMGKCNVDGLQWQFLFSSHLSLNSAYFRCEK